MSKGKSVLSFILVILIIAGLLLTAFFGIEIGNFKIPSVFDEEDGIRRGLDLVGGSVITYEAEKPDEMNDDDFQNNMESVRAMLQQRLDSLGYSDSILYFTGKNRITIEIPSITNPEKAVQELGATAKLQFVDSDGKIVIEGTDIAEAKPAHGPVSTPNVNEYYIQLKLSKDAVSKFAAATKKAATQPEGKNYIAIMLDGKEISRPHVNEEINSDTCVISGDYDAETVKYQAGIISAGKLPFDLKNVELRSVGPTLGEGALSSSVLAALIGVGLVCLFLLIVYRLPGLMACVALAFYIGLIAICLAIFKINLSLPGVAGVILSIGMAVDANVIIFERIKEELRLGKTTKSAVKSGFDRAFVAILDSNVTTFIAAIVLGIFGTGPIQGFAWTLGIGVVASMITSVFVTKLLLNCLVGMGIRNIKAYGA